MWASVIAISVIMAALWGVSFLVIFGKDGSDSHKSSKQ